MPMFVSDELVPVTVDNVNTIWIKARMGFGDRSRMQDALYARPGGGKIEVRLGEYNIALLKANIARWEGPAFGGRPVTPENIEQLDPGEPLVERVLAEIQERNLDHVDPKASTSGSGSPSTASE